jgi:nucleoside-diphosphate-sugar epimerase
MAEVLILGCGDLGARIAARHRARGERVTGVVRHEASAARLAAAGIEPCVLDLDRSRGALPAADAVYYLAPPPPEGRADPRMARVLALLRPPRRMLYLGTTGVYGDRGGAWTDEQTPVAPSADRAWRRLDAERRVKLWCRERDVASVVVRAAAIYGPGRLPVERLRAGATVLAPEESGYTNRIHVEDLADVCVAALERGTDGAVYDAADGSPSSTAEYYAAVAARFGLPPPRVVTRAEAAAELSEAALEYAGESKRIRARRIRDELGVALQYPDLASGLAGC